MKIVYVFAIYVTLAAFSYESKAQAIRIGGSSVGQVGKRQAQVESNGIAGPTLRINNRLQARIDTRQENRLDADYRVPQDTLKSFAVANQVLQKPEAKFSGPR
ncbi:hypothetical protein [Sphingomonas sp. 1185]|uniref:hypothetical protein n=1 Tax=Sphingomonas sp. 1185 TaxID=3156411 RepID=UPI003395CA6C